jgi:predicted 2-oxoglutarate/Fe(II)-dependent dioxygenase YbiX
VKELKTNETYAWAICNFSEEEIQKIKNLNLSYGQGAIDVGNVNYKVRNSKVGWVHPLEENNWIYEKITNVLNYVNNEFFQFDLTSIESLQLTEYDESYGGFYSKHVDAGYDVHMNRKLSFTLFLNDPSDYRGGELLLYNSEEPIKPEQKKGNIVFFPSYVLHEVTPVVSGTRNTLVGWVNGPRFR